MLATARRVLGRSSAAEEAAQDAYVLFARKALAIPPERTGPWLYRAVLNVARNRVRAEARRTRREARVREVAAVLGEPGRSEPAPLGGMLDEAISRLPERQQACVIACYFEGISQVEQARRLGCSQAALSQLKARALDNLRKALLALGVTCGADALASQLSSDLLRAEPSACARVAAEAVARAARAGAEAGPWAAVLAGGALLGLAVAWWAWSAGRGGNNDGERTAAVAPVPVRESGPRAAAAEKTENIPEPRREASRNVSLRRLRNFSDLRDRLATAFEQARSSSSLEALLQLNLPLAESALRALFERARDGRDFARLLLNEVIMRTPDAFLSWASELPEMQPDGLEDIWRQSASLFGRLRLTSYFPSEATLAKLLAAFPPELRDQFESKLMENVPSRDPRFYIDAVLARADLADGQRVNSLLSSLAVWDPERLGEALDLISGSFQGAPRDNLLEAVAQRLVLLRPDLVPELLRKYQGTSVEKTLLASLPLGLLGEGLSQEAVAALGNLQGEVRSDALRLVARQWMLLDEGAAVEWINGLKSEGEYNLAIMGGFEHMSYESQLATVREIQPAESDPALERALAHGVYRTASYIDPEGGAALIATYLETRGIGPIARSMVQKNAEGADDWTPPTIMFRAIWNNLRAFNQAGRPEAGLRFLGGLRFANEAEYLDMARTPVEAWAKKDPAAASAWVRTAPGLSQTTKDDLLATARKASANGAAPPPR